MMKKSLLFIALVTIFWCRAQHIDDNENQNRLLSIQNKLELLAVDNVGLSENLKSDINVTNVSLSNFLIGVANLHGLNLNVDPNLESIAIVNNFSNVSVADLLLFLCKQYSLDIDFTGSILSISRYNPPPQEIPEKEVNAAFDPLNNTISLDLNNDSLEKSFRKIMDVSGQNLLFSTGMESIPLTLYLKDVPLEMALEKLAQTNNLTYNKSRDGFYLFDKINQPSNEASSGRRTTNFSSNFNYQIIDTTSRIVTVDFKNVPIENIIKELSLDLDLDIYMATPLSAAGNTTFKARQIAYDELLNKIFESKSNYTRSPVVTDNARPNQSRNSCLLYTSPSPRDS